MLMRTEPFRELDRVAHQLLDTAADAGLSSLINPYQ
jgi:hypothetical protein